MASPAGGKRARLLVLPETLDAAIALLSDLHFGESYLGETRLPPLSYTIVADLLRLGGKVEQLVRQNCAAHNQAILCQLPQYLRGLVAEYQASEGYTLSDFEQYVLLGDLVTWASPTAFQFLAEYLTQQDLLVKIKTRLERWPGLKASTDKLVPIPGNHDKLLRRDLQLYNDGVSARLQIAPWGVNAVTLIDRAIGTQRALFLAVDASVYTKQSLTIDFHATRHLARGEITKSILREVAGYKDELVRARGKAYRILVIHYAVHFGRATKMSADLAALNYVLPHECDGVDELFEELGPDAIDFAIHGHLHIARKYNFQGVPVLSTGSVSQLDAEPNGFHVLKFMNSGQVYAEYHVWGEGGFDIDPDENGERSGVLI